MTTPILCLPTRQGASVASGVRMTPRGRAVLVSAVSLLLLGVVLAAVLGSVVHERSMTVQQQVDPGADAATVVVGVPGAVLAAEGRATAHTVSEGDTLWDLAVALSRGGDPRPVVDRIRQLNAMAGSSLTVGERLWLPVPAQ